MTESDISLHLTSCEGDTSIAKTWLIYLTFVFSFRQTYLSTKSIIILTLLIP